MFREMRRRRQKLDETEVRTILEEGTTGILAVMGEGCYPYAVPVNYVYKNNKIYLHSATEGHKIDALRSHDKVSFCVIARDTVVPEALTTYFASVIVFGRARILEREEDIVQAAEWLGLKYSSDVDFIRESIRRSRGRLCCIEIAIDHVTGKEAIELSERRQTT